MGGVIFTTVQMQDLEDVGGDAARGRWTVPLRVGDRRCRWSIALLVPAWTVAACWFWAVRRQHACAVLCHALALVVAWRVLCRTTVAHDRVTFRFWNLWIVSLYVLPLAAEKY